LISHWNFPEDIVIGGKEPKTFLTSKGKIPNKLSNEEQMMFYDMMMYLPDDILVKIDRAAMAVSLETRVPFLDHRVIDLASRLPLHMKIRSGINKWCLREVLYKRVPKKLIERPKMGFGVPIGDWLKGPLRDWAEHLLDEKRIIQSGYFQNSEIQKKWQEHCSGERNWQYYLWDILMFESWREEEGL
jgi:asparagine synthase (glutamine-hydrolysing)